MGGGKCVLVAGSCVRDRSGMVSGSEALVELGRWGFVAQAEKHQRLSDSR